MKRLHSEMTKYSDMVEAMYQEVIGNKNSQPIVWDIFTARGDKYAAHSVAIDQSSEKLRKMGFMPMFVYDKQHFQANMYPEGTRAHAHGASKQDMLDLPKMLNNPVAILTERCGVNRSDAGSNEYGLLVFLCAKKTWNMQQYYLAAVQPEDYHDGLLKKGYASKVVSYYEIGEAQFNAMLRDSLCGQRHMLYFDRNAYSGIRSSSKPHEFNGMKSFSESILGHFNQRANLGATIQVHNAALQYAVTATLNQFIIWRNTEGTGFPLFHNALRTFGDPESSPRDMVNARNLISKIGAHSNDRVARLRATEQVDKMFADAYVKYMTPARQAFYPQKATQGLNKIEIAHVGDIEYLKEVADKYSRSAPTLKNLNVVFAGGVTGIPNVVKAQEISGKIETELETCMGKIVDQKLADFRQKQLDEQAFGFRYNDLQANDQDINVLSYSSEFEINGRG